MGAKSAARTVSNPFDWQKLSKEEWGHTVMNEIRNTEQNLPTTDSSAMNPFDVGDLEPHKSRLMPVLLALLAFAVLVGLFTIGIVAYLFLSI